MPYRYRAWRFANSRNAVGSSWAVRRSSSASSGTRCASSDAETTISPVLLPSRVIFFQQPLGIFRAEQEVDFRYAATVGRPVSNSPPQPLSYCGRHAVALIPHMDKTRRHGPAVPNLSRARAGRLLLYVAYDRRFPPPDAAGRGFCAGRHTPQPPRAAVRQRPEHAPHRLDFAQGVLLAAA